MSSSLSGLSKLKADKRIAEIAEVSPTSDYPMPATDGAGGALVIRPTPHDAGRSDAVVSRMDELQDRGWFSQGAVVAREDGENATISATSKLAFQARAAHLLMSRAEACISFGSVPLAEAALSDLESATDLPVDPAVISQLKGKVRALAAVASSGGTLEESTVSSDVVWKRRGGGTSLVGVVQIGNSDRNHGGNWLAANVTVEPGFVLNGGTIRVSGGSHSFKGTAEKPCILRDLKIECEYTGTVSAEYTIFEDCTLAKGGSYHWNDGYSSKWALQDCLLFRSSFADLSRMDYGIKVLRCDLYRSKLSGRDWGYLKTETINDDGAQRSRGDWSRVDECNLYNCDLSVSSVWMVQKCNLFGCRVVDPATFLSKTNLQVELGLRPPEKSLLDDLSAKTSDGGSGRVSYSRAVKLYSRSKPCTLWRLASPDNQPDPPAN